PLCLPLEQARILSGLCRRIRDLKWKDAGSFISLMKRRGITPNEAAQQADNDKQMEMVHVYRKYEESLRARGVLDFDSIVIETARLLSNREDVRARWQYKYVVVDEAQDTDAMQWKVVRLISSQHGNVLAVGDENQGMYSWRGSEANLTDYFCANFPNSTVFPLPVNYRSTQAIVEYCKGIAPVKNETITNLSTPNEQGVPVAYYLFPRDDEEAKQVLNSIIDLGNTAILSRTNRQLATFESECGDRGLRYKLLGKSGFWGQREIKDVVGVVGSIVMPSDNNILRMLSAHCELTKFLRKNDSHEHTSTITMLKRFQQYQPMENGKPTLLHKLLSRFDSGESSQNEIIRNASMLIHSMRGTANTRPGKEAMLEVVQRFGLLSVYDGDDDADDIDNDPRDNITKLIDYAAQQGSLAKFYEYTQRVHRARLARTNCLTLSTIHQAKGKEWNRVHVVGVNDGILPHLKGEESE